MRHLMLAIALLSASLVAGALAIVVLIPTSLTARLIILAFVPAILAMTIAVTLTGKGAVPRWVEPSSEGFIAWYIGFSREFRAKDIASTEVRSSRGSSAIILHMRDNRESGLSDVEPQIANEIVNHLRRLG